MNRFNLTFSGEIQAGLVPEQVKLRFAKMFSIDDPERLERFFSGQSIILRRNLERKEAAELFQDLRDIGVVSELVKITVSEITGVTADTGIPAKPAAKKTTKKPATKTARSPTPKSAESAKTKKARTAAATAKLLAEEKQLAAQEQSHLHEEEAKRILEEEARREATEKKAAAIRKDLKEEKRRAANEVAELEKKRLAAEKADKRKNEREAKARRQAAEAAAQRRAELEVQRHQELEEETELKAQMEAVQRKEAEEAQRLQAELEDIQRQETAAKAELQAQLQEKERQAELEAARVKAEAKARLQTELASKEKLATQEAGRIKAEAQRRKEAAERESAERSQKVAHEQANLQAKQRKNKAKQASNQLELLLPASNEAVDLAHENLARYESTPSSPSSPSRPIITPAVPNTAPNVTAAAPSVTPGTGKTGKTRVKTTLDVPLRSNASGTQHPTEPRRKRQPGEPNLYQLQAFRNNQDIRGRAAAARHKMRQALAVGSCAALALLITGSLFLRLEPPLTINAPHAMAIDSQSRPLLVAGEWLLLHDRGGKSTQKLSLSDIGVAALGAPMQFTDEGELLAAGKLSEPALQSSSETLPELNKTELLRCNIEKQACKPFAANTTLTNVAAFTINPIDGTLLLLDSRAGELRKLTSDGKFLAATAVNIPAWPTLRLQSGLLFMNSAAGAAISVFRYDTAAFGQQLDEVLLLPAPAVAAKQTRTGDFIWSGSSWWASLYNPATMDAGLYRFDAKWNYLGQASVAGGKELLQLASWGEKTLANNHSELALMRFNGQGQAETPMLSQQLAELVAERQSRSDFTTLGWRSALFVFMLTACAGLLAAWIQGLRALVYQPQRERGAPPVDDLANQLQWLDQVPKREAILRRRSISYALFVVALVLLAIGSNVSAMQLAAILIAASGPAILLILLSKTPAGNIAVMEEHVLLVDHRGVYQRGSGSDIQHRGSFLMIDDIVVFTGNRMIPTFTPEQVASQVRPLASGGVKVDRNTLLVKLLESRHPFASGTIATIISLTIALTLLGVTEIL